MKRNARTWLQAGLALGMCILTAEVAQAGVAPFAPMPPAALADGGTQLVWSTNPAPWWDGLGIPFEAEIWRGEKSGGASGQSMLVHEERATSVEFGSVLRVDVGGVPYVYFVANYDGIITYLKRVPLAGGASAIVSRTPFIGGRDVKSDGAYLYWADAEGVRRMAIAGGAITTLYRTNRAGQIGLDEHYLYFNVGASVHRVPKAGGAVTLQLTAWDPVTDLVVHATAAQTTLYWADSHAGVMSQPVGSNVWSIHQLPMEYHTVHSIAFDGARLFWTDCATQVGTCETRQLDGQQVLKLYGSNQYNHRARNLVTDGAFVFWGNDQEIMRYTHTSRPSVVFDPAVIRGLREGRGSITASAHVVPSGGDRPYTYDYRIDNPVFHVDVSPSGPTVPVWASLAACDTLGARLTVTVTDAIGRKATAAADVEFTSIRAPGGTCD